MEIKTDLIVISPTDNNIISHIVGKFTILLDEYN